MDLKNNERLIEVRTAYALNRIYNYKNRKNFKEHSILLQCLVESIDETNNERFQDLIANSYEEKILGASKKEIYAAFKAFYDSNYAVAKKMGVSSSYLYRNYGDLINRNYINDDFIKSLVPACSDDYLPMLNFMNSFIDKFHYLSGDAYYEYYDHPRVLELEFYLIYQKLYEIYNGSTNLEKFLFKLTTALELDWNTIAYLIRNIYIIERLNVDKVIGTKQFKQELFNLGYLKGFAKYKIGNELFGKDGKYYYTKGYEFMTKDITKDSWEFQLTFVATLDWQVIKKDDLMKLIEVFRSFANEEL